MWVQPLGQENLLEKKMATHSSILSRKFHRQRSLVGYSPQGLKQADTTEVTWRAHPAYPPHPVHFTGMLIPPKPASL